MLFRPRNVFIAIVLLALCTRLYNLPYPKAYYFDEVYHAFTAKLIARNDPRAFEWTHGDTIETDAYVDWLHPPMAKYSQAIMIRVFGENSVGWRMSSVLFGVGVITMTGLLAQKLFQKPWLSVTASGIAALDGLLLAQSRIAMNDIHVVFGFLTTLYAYVWYRQRPAYWRLLIVGLAIGLTIATKWSGAFVWATILLFEATALLWAEWRVFRVSAPSVLDALFSLLKQSCIRCIALLVLPFLIYVLSYSQMFLQGKDFEYFKQLHQQIFWYQFNLDATHTYQSKAIEWVFDIRPVWYFVEYLPNGQRADIYNTGNPFIYVLGVLAAVTSVVFLSLRVRKTLIKQFQQKTAKRLEPLSVSSLILSPMKALPTQEFSLSVLLITYFLCWVPWVFSPRIMFSYHYAPAIPLLSILIAFWFSQIWSWSQMLHKQKARKGIRLILIFLVLLTLLFFIAWYPQWVAIPLASSLKDSFYFAIPSWR